MAKLLKKLIYIAFCSSLLACNSSDVKDALELIDDPPRRAINRSQLGVNAFLNDSRFGTIDQQLREVRDTLDVHYVRLLFNWDNGVSPSPDSALNFSFYDDIVAALPAGVDAIIVLTGLPGWMSDPSQWEQGDPRITFVERWVRPVVRRYRGNGRVIGFEIWNEPNMLANPDNTTLGIAADAPQYVAMLARAFSVIRDLAPGKLVLNAATTAINQNYPETISYNRDMREAGLTQFIDVFAAHYYGKQYENLIRDHGVADFLNGLNKEIWITESGAQGVNSQLPYAEEVWPYLREKIPSIGRIYYYQFAEATPAETTYGLRNLTPGFELSDLYIHLRDTR